ncbi:VIT1/CCC1 transporter family protein [Candidatus Roizmanbacteria bacterium]|nr:VIT1/CCC1 transporter family protein [Candidatus Roizmanbacteria bacterium]
MSRVDQARQAFLDNNVDKIKNAHTRKAIHTDIHHHEAHLKGFNLPEIILGGQDGLVNVLGVILGVAAATSSSQIVIVAGLAATFAESVSMGAVAYTAKIAEADYYQSELEREKWEIDHIPEGEREEVRALYENYGFKGKVLDEIVDKITSDKHVWLQIMMEQELKLEPVDRKQAIPAAFIVGVSAIIGSFIPLTPFFFMTIKNAAVSAMVISAISLFIVGYYKAKKTLGRSFLQQGIEMMLIGMISALVGYFVGSLFKISNF